MEKHVHNLVSLLPRQCAVIIIPHLITDFITNPPGDYSVFLLTQIFVLFTDYGDSSYFEENLLSGNFDPI